MQNHHFKLWGKILILDEPIATETKHRLLSLLFPRAYQPKRTMGTKKIQDTKPAREWKDLIIFIRCIMKKTNRRQQSGLIF